MNRRSFLAGLFGVATSGSLVCWIKSSDAVPLLTGVEAPSDIPASDALAAPDGTPVQYYRRQSRRVYRRQNRRQYRRDYYRYGGRYGGYGRYNGYGHYGGYGSRRVCRAYLDRWGNRRWGCRYIEDYY